MRRLKKILVKLKKRIERALSNVPKRKFFFQIYCRLFAVNRKVVLIESFHGQNISDSSLEFAKELLRSYPNQYKIYFASENVKEHRKFIDSIGLDVKLIDVETLRYPKILATAGYILTNASLPIYFIKREGQVYLQTWHGTPLKTLGKKMRMGIESLYIAQHSFLQADYLTQPNDFTKDIIMQDYNLEELYTGKVVMAGYPRNKIFMQPEEGERLREKMGLTDKTVYIYMPTWRGTSNHTVVTTDYANRIQAIFKKLDNYLKDDQIFYVKFHPILRDAVSLDSYKHIKQFPNNVEPYAFISSADALVTDYSSVFFDFSLTKKPIVLFLYDFDEYMHDRGINMDIRELPFRQVYTTEELGECLGSGACLSDRYDDTEYFKTFFKYDSPDVTEKLLKMVFSGDTGDFEVHDYAKNRDKRLRVIEPKDVKTAYDFNTIAHAADENTVVLLYKKWFKGELSQILHDKYNDAFKYVITTYTPPRTFIEEMFALLGSKRMRERIHLRDIQRTFPNLNIDPKFIRDYGAFDKDCSVAKHDTVIIPMSRIEASADNNPTVTFTVPDGYTPVSAVVTGYLGNTLIYMRDLTAAELESSTVEYDLSEVVENMTAYRKQFISLGLIATDKKGRKKLLVFTDRSKLNTSVFRSERNRFSSFFAPITKTFMLPADYYTVDLQKLYFSVEAKQKERLANYDLRPTPVEVCVAPFIDSETGYLSLSVCAPEESVSAMSSGAVLKKVSCHGKLCSLNIFVPGVDRDMITGAVLKYRSKTEAISIDLECTAHRKRGGTLIKVRHRFDDTQGLKEVFWDLRIILDLDGTQGLLRVQGSSIYNQLKFYFTNCQCNVDKNNIIFPYLGTGNVLCFLYRSVAKYDTSRIRRKEIAAYLIYRLFGAYWRKKKLRIVFEKFCHTAQDNSYYFFRYCMEELPEKEKQNIFYIIDKSAPDYQKIAEYDDHIIPFMSIRHMIYAMASNVCISTDSTSHLYLWRTKPSLIRRAIKRKHNELFLQHGVIALKQVHQIFGKRSNSPMRYFVTSSKDEHDIIVSDFGYKSEEVPIIGLCRWDVLKDTSADSEQKTILLMPTWRSWLEEVDDSVFIESDYYTNYSALLTNDRLSKLLSDNNIKLVLYLHPKFAEYTETFKDKVSENITYVPFGQQPLNDLIMQCSMLITDYSSVCWDALYINKPVLFYQFDYERYNVAHGSYINMEKDLLGDRTTDLDKLIDYIGEYIDGGLKIKPEFEKKAYDYFMYHDRENCKRTFDFIKSQGL